MKKHNNAKSFVKTFGKKIARIKVYFMLSVLYVCLSLFSEYLYWRMELVTIPYVIDIIGAVIAILTGILGLIIIVVHITNFEESFKRKLGITLLIILTYIVLNYLPPLISYYFITI